MLYPISYFDGRLFVWKKASEDFLIKKFIRNENCDGSFEDEGVLSLPITGKKDRNYTVHVAGENLEALYIVAEDESERNGFFVSIYSVRRENSVWSVRDVGCFQVKESIIGKIHLSQDLTVIWNSHDSLNVVCYRSFLRVNSVLRVPFTETLKKILLLHTICFDIGEFSDSEKVNVFLVVTKTLISNNENGILFCVLIVDSPSDSFETRLLRLSADYFIARFYSSIISAINITATCLHNNDNKFTSSNIIKNIGEKFEWSKNSTIVCTERKQFIVFISGCTQYICSIPFPDVHQIINFKTYSPVRTFYILQSLKGACAVKKCEFSKELQICNSWDDSIAAFVGDFINSGTLQLLFISHLDQDLITDTCILTNLATSFYPRTASFVHNTSWNKDAIKGMKKTIVAGQIAFSEAKRKQKEMQNVIEEITQTLEFAMSGDLSRSKICDSNLVNIIPPNKGPLSLVGTKKETPLVAIDVVTMWKTLVQDHWILGWSLINESNLILSDFNIYLGTLKETLEYKYKCYKHLSSDIHHQPNLYFDEKYSGDLKQGELLSIVISLPLPAFTCSELDITCIIKWKNGSISHPGLPFKQQLPLKCQLCVHTALEKRHDIFKELSAVQQLMSLRVLQDRVLLHLTSEHTDLAQLEKILTLTLEYYPYTLIHLSSKINIFMDPLSPLYGVNFSINYSSPRKAESEVHYREINQLLLFVHWLHTAVPEDITASVEFIFGNKLKQEFLLSMKEELLFIISLMKRQNTTINLSTVDKSDLNSLQKQLKNEHEQILKNSLALSFQEYIEFRLCLLEKESNNDDISGQMILYK